MQKFFLAALMLFASATPILAQDVEVTADGIPIFPVFLNDSGNGILRFSDPEEREIPFTAANGMLAPKSSRPFEAWSTLGTWTGPELSLCIQHMTPARLELTNAIQLYSPTEERVIARFRFVFNAEKAEQIISADGGTEPGVCHSNFLK